VKLFHLGIAAQMMRAWLGARLDALLQTTRRQPLAWRGPTPGQRSRVPDSNRSRRRADGIPHGRSGAKLARKALEGKVGLRA
jgi:hypothetical protein